MKLVYALWKPSFELKLIYSKQIMEAVQYKHYLQEKSLPMKIVRYFFDGGVFFCSNNCFSDK